MSPAKHWKFGASRRGLFIRRCWICHRLIWPWQHRGWRVGDGGTARFHALCVKP